jgi:hypothetical protein
MAEIDIDKIKSTLSRAKKARALDPRLVAPNRQESSTTARDMQKLLPFLEKAGLDVAALEKILKEDELHADHKPTADAVKRHAWMKKTIIKKHEGARRCAPHSSLDASRFCARPTRGHREHTAFLHLAAAGRHPHAIEPGNGRQLGKRAARDERSR